MDSYELQGAIFDVKNKLTLTVSALEYSKDNSENANHKTTAIDNCILNGVCQALYESVGYIDKIIDEL